MPYSANKNILIPAQGDTDIQTPSDEVAFPENVPEMVSNFTGLQVQDLTELSTTYDTL